MTIMQSFFAFQSAAPIGQQLFSTVGTTNWLVPEGVTSISVVCIGGGGGGAHSDTSAGRGGGGGGALSYTNNIAVTPNETLTVVVGASGTSIAPDTSSPGGDSSVSRGATVLVLAKGGGGGSGFTAGTGGQAASGVGDVNTLAETAADQYLTAEAVVLADPVTQLMV